MKKAIICILVCILLILSTIIPVTGTTLSDKTSKPLTMGSILYVGGSGPNNYTKIQDAIDNSSDGDTVFVFDDSSPYKQSINIDKSIIIEGENKTTTIIEGWSSIGADYVIVKDFMFHLKGPAMRIANFSNIIIEDCVFNNPAGIGLQIENSSNDIIRNCTFNNNTNDLGVMFTIGNSNTIEISNCDFFDNPETFAFPWLIDVELSSGITIHHCSFGRNYEFSVGVGFSRKITIHHCNFTHNYAGGVYAYASVIQLTSNNFINNDGPGMRIGFLGSCDLRNNWWGSPQGPSINFTTLYSLFTVHGSMRIRNVDNGDIVDFYGITGIVPLLKLIRLIPWLTEQVPDAGSHIRNKTI